MWVAGAAAASAGAGAAAAMPRISCRTRANSSGVMAAKSRVRRSSTSLAPLGLTTPPSSSTPPAGGAPGRALPLPGRRVRRGDEARGPHAGTRRPRRGRTPRGPRRARRASAAASSRRRRGGSGRRRRARAARRRPAPGRPRARPRASTRPKTTRWRTTASLTAHVRRATSPASASSRRASRSSWYLSTEPSVAWTFSTSSSCCPRAVRASHPVDRLREPRRLLQVERAQLRREARRLLGEPLGDARHAQLGRSRSRARPRGGRSSGRGSGA